MNSKDFLDLADELVRRKDEAALRTAVSRAYYGAFNHMAEFYRSKGIIFGKQDNVHVKLRDCMKYSGCDDVAAVAALLGSVHAERKRADYDMALRTFRQCSACEATVLNARQCLVDFDKHRDKSVDGAKKYFTVVLGYPAPTSR